MTRARVLISPEGTPIPIGVGSESARVARLAENAVVQCEAFMAEQIIAKRVQFNYRDLYSLGLALYRQGSQNLVEENVIREKTDHLLEFLKAANRLEEGDNGEVSVKVC